MAHINDSFIDALIEEYAYTPKMSDEEAVRLIFDLAIANNSIYSNLRDELGKPDSEANPEHHKHFYNKLREKMRKEMHVPPNQFLPFVPTEISFELGRAMSTRNRQEIDRIGELAAQTYHNDPRPFDRFAVKANYIEGVQ